MTITVITVRHRSASGRTDGRWEKTGDVIHVYTRIGSLPKSMAIPVCSQGRPRIGAHPIIRLDGERWAILPARYVLEFPNRVETLMARSCPIGDVMAVGEQLVIAQVPADVDIELDAL